MPESGSGRALFRIAQQTSAATEEPIELESRCWPEAIEAETGPLSLFDTHTHFGRNDPDGPPTGALKPARPCHGARLLGSPPPGRRFPRPLQYAMLALAVARTPDVALPSP